MNPIALRMIRPLLLGSVLAFALPVAAAPFSYRGTLTDRGTPASGDYGFRISFYDAQSGGKRLAPATTLDGVRVSDGAFDASLDLEPSLMARDTLWLQVEVRDADGSFVPLAERESMQPKALAAGVCWDTQGNAGTNGTTDFLGTTDSQALNLKVNNVTALRLEPATGYPNVIGGKDGSMSAGVTSGTISGGLGNLVGDSLGTIGGGFDNIAGDSTGISSPGATVGGGYFNEASGLFATIGGGFQNLARGSDATVPGGNDNCAGGSGSFAAGINAKVRAPLGSGQCTGVPDGDDGNGDNGTFVWADDRSTDFVSTGPRQFLVRAEGGVGINTNTPAVNDAVSLYVQGFNTTSGTVAFRSPKGGGTILSHVHYGAGGDWFIRSAVNTGKVVIQDTGGTVSIGTSSVVAGHLIDTGANGAHLTTGGAWTNGSSRLFKEAFESVDAGAILDKVLALPLSTWRYKNSPEGEHLGPMAEDFSAAFGLGGDDRHIATVDADGVALAAIQGLNERLVRTAEQLERENAELRARLDRLERRETHFPSGSEATRQAVGHAND